MENSKFISLLFRDKSKPATEEERELCRKLDGFLDRLLMRIHTSTSLLVYLFDAQVTDTGEIELVFNKLPAEIIPQVTNLISVPDTKAFEFRSKHGINFNGFRFKPSDDLLKDL